MAQARQFLMELQGRPVKEVLAEIEERQHRLVTGFLPDASEDSDSPRFWGE